MAGIEPILPAALRASCYLIAGVLLGGCCGPEYRDSVAPQAVLAVIDGEPAVGLGLVDMDVVDNDPHCGGDVSVRWAGVLLVRPESGAAFGLIEAPRGEVDRSEHEPTLPPLMGVAAAPDAEGRTSVVAHFDPVGGPPGDARLWPEGPSSLSGVLDVVTGADVVVATRRTSATANAITGWSPARGEVWSLPTEIPPGCSVEPELRTSPDGSYLVFTQRQLCREGGARTWVTVLRTANGEQIGEVHSPAERERVGGAVADDGTSLLWISEEEQWMVRSVAGTEVGRLTTRISRPRDAYAWGDRWLIHGAADVVVVAGDGTELARATIEGIDGQQRVVTNEGLWLLESSRGRTGKNFSVDTHCVTHYGESLLAQEPLCFDGPAHIAALDLARRR